MKWVVCEMEGEFHESVAINSDTIKNVLILVDPRLWHHYHTVESDKVKLGERTHDEAGDIIIETNDGKFYRFFEGGSGWEEFQNKEINSEIIYQRLLQALGSAEDGVVIFPCISDVSPAYRSHKVIVLFDYHMDMEYVHYNEDGFGVMKIRDCCGYRLDEFPKLNQECSESIDGSVTLKKCGE